MPRRRPSAWCRYAETPEAIAGIPMTDRTSAAREAAGHTRGGCQCLAARPPPATGDDGAEVDHEGNRRDEEADRVRDIEGQAQAQPHERDGQCSRERHAEVGPGG